ncbi:MAG TPA: LON peptidase substrate-binding domain-containing protein, partial [Gammaproteobacteria bacterium]|nr:LON peptidase substrate-binding domain-containing protein [Gammaproteobacteria bacterium]
MNDENFPDAELANNGDGPGSEIAVASEVRPSTLHLLPVSERPFFPAQSVPVLMEEQPWLSTVEAVGNTSHHLVGLALIGHEQGARARPEDFHAMGTVVRMHHPMRSSGKIQFIAEGLQRFRIVRWLSKEPPFTVQVEYPEETGDDPDQ